MKVYIIIRNDDKCRVIITLIMRNPISYTCKKLLYDSRIVSLKSIIVKKITNSANPFHYF